MDYLYSTVVDPKGYETEGLCDGIDLRKTNYTEREDRGAIRAQHDWAKYVGPCCEYRGTLGPVYSFMSVCVPECIPDRLDLIAYANEFAFMHDDLLDRISWVDAEQENDDMMHAFLEGAEKSMTDSEIRESGRLGRKRMQSELSLEMMAVDRECAITTLRAWAKFLEVGSGRQHAKRFTSLKEYLPYRIMDVGEMFWYGVVTYGMGLHIPGHETEACRQLMADAWIAVGLQNDLWSWPKERDEAARKGDDYVINAIWVLTQEYQVDVSGAQDMCRKLIKEYVAKYLQTIKDTRNDETLSKDLRKYIEAFQYAISGNVVWSLTCPRYNPAANFNETQLNAMHNHMPECSSTSSISDTTNTSFKQARASSSRTSSPLSGRSDLYKILTKPDSLQSGAADSQQIAEEVAAAPYEYVSSLPSKGIREQFLDAINVWFTVPKIALDKIKDVVKMLHNASLLLDDFQDNSPLRRGRPSAHTVFGPPQTVNSSNLIVIKAVQQIHSFSGPQTALDAMEDILTLFQGQALDIHWTYNGICPSLEEYLEMVDAKTGTLFSLACKLIASHSSVPVKEDASWRSVKNMTTALGRYFQIRDDYQNLVSAEYWDQKGFCEDLDEGKYSLPIIHTLRTVQGQAKLQLISTLSTRRSQGRLTHEQRQLVLETVKACGALEWTKSILTDLHAHLVDLIEKVELDFGDENPILRASVELLRI